MKKTLYGKIRDDVREITSVLCKYKDVEMIAKAFFIDYVHFSIAISSKLNISNFMGKSTLLIYDRNTELQSGGTKFLVYKIVMLK